MTFAYRSSLFLAASGAALLIAGAASAQEAPADTTAIDDIVVTGSRVPSRSRLDTLAPVDVVTAETLSTRGTTEFAAALAQTVPSLTFARPSVVDGTDSIRPATLRGLSPDQTLVLLNGTRRHASALVNVNGSIGRGSAAVDLNAIPTGALDRVEVLRDGASAQYGSDAIAGVINLRLKEAREGGGASVTYGQYFTTVETARGERDETDGRTVTASAWQGLGLGSDGFLTLSAEYLNREPTNRSDYDPRVTPTAITARAGDPKVEQWTVFANAGKPLNADWKAYGWAGYQHRDSESAAFPRLQNNTNNVVSIYPNGFLPKIAVNSQDLSLAGGVKGEIAGWSADFSLVYGRNALDFRTEDSLNATYGAASPTSFDSGGLTYDQLVFGADFARQFEVGLSGPLNFAWGLEARREGYKIDAGQPESWNRGPLGANTALAGGAQGFVGFQPSNEVDEDRDAVALYADVEIPLTDKFTVEGALRVEDYSDFGDAQTGKLAARYDFSPNFALRGSVSTGFRAPSLQQSFFTSTSSVIQNGAVVETGTFPATSQVATVLGARALKPETSTNYSLGAVVRLGNFDLTVDAYSIKIEDQIALSELINRSFSTDVAALLDPLGVQAARFFLNGVTTETKGVDIVGRYRLRTETAGNWDFTVAANVNDVSVSKWPTSTSVLNPAPTLFSRQRILTIEEGTPDTKVSTSADWSLGRWGATARATYYADVLQPGSTAASDYSTGAKTTVDLEGRFQVTDRIGVAVGVDNVFDEYPDFVPETLNSNGVLGFPYYSPFGFNGRYGYARLSVKW
ncbi:MULTISPECIES: TonB-dependent siderophore receptor [unclassified Brevundimonas]|uniref:TonB-dependent receptor plug domain-containing protein n=1 Tax=unclassified Brevundimonas TaxID=2622653 RepID=UPI000CFB418C|nr:MULTISPECIES: TonB-dependent receptor [unclassified Brevundimonas]PRA32645.1 TonB-dependent receptor [Brevundimonas sp. MYb27]PQZ77609.1 TonB-dependent receptor [Brevundimonas sp. MYb31]PRB16855.1 TonB-dependent receptor [Brevundimonas sp. MYb52]PRB37430.1 TonB-dependent receptor [Brevundimonas sp. MYb46]PRB47662.1 TonB-dependent receptor [Brevundimonas sp. MYb33]